MIAIEINRLEKKKKMFLRKKKQRFDREQQICDGKKTNKKQKVIGTLARIKR